jgi:signal transduction histidine kinase
LSGITPPRILEFDVVKRDGSRAVVDVSARRLFKNRAAAGYQVSVRDMTEQKDLREMLVKAERLGAIGQVGIAMRHEINNPLTTVIGNVELLLERSREKDKEGAARLEVVLNNALRIAEIIRRVEEIKQDKVVEYLKGIKMTDLKNE